MNGGWALISVLELKKWTPLKRTTKFQALFERLPPEQLKQLQHLFAQWLCELLKHEIQKAIDSQKFPVHYKPLSINYTAQKKEQGLASGFWRATKFLRNHINVWEKNGTWHIGFPEALKHPSSGDPLLKIAQELEKGDPKRRLPPRPLFTPLADRISKNAPLWFERFLQKKQPQLYSALLTS